MIRLCFLLITNNKRYLYLMIKFKDSVTSQPKDLNPSVTLTISAVQKSENTLIVPKGEETVLMGGVEVPIVTEGDGLYKDDTEEGRYIYRGDNPNNYMTFNGETAGWRVIAFENDGTIKIVKNSSLSTINFDNQNRVLFDASYCTDIRGCNFFASSSSTIDENGQIVSSIIHNDILYNLPEKKSIANQYLNSTGIYDNDGFYNNLLSASKKLIVSHKFPIGIVESIENISNVIKDENNYYWQGNVGMITVSDYMNSIINESSYITSITYWQWLINPTNNSSQLWSIRLNKLSNYGYVYYGSGSNVGIIPVVYIKSDFQLKGNGTQIEPYAIKTE